MCDGPGKSQLTDITPNTQARNWIVDGDNYSNTAKTIEHEFFTLGKKTVSLIVTDIFGCKGVKTFVDTIEVLPNLEFDFDADVKQGCIPQTVNFSLTKDPSSIYAKKYYWDFPGATNERDSGLCNFDYEYYVQAVEPSGLYKSNSYRVTKRPLYASNPFVSNVKKVTVSNGDEITILWKKSVFANNGGYELEKYQNNEDNFMYAIPISSNEDTIYIDSDVSVNSNSYVYKLYEVDNCQEKNQTDREGKSIVIDGYSDDDGFHVFWTKYRQWESGVRKYNLLNFDVDNQENKELIGSTLPNDTLFHDSVKYKE